MIEKNCKETVPSVKPAFIYFHIPKCAGNSVKASLGIRERVLSVDQDRSLSWRQGIFKRFGWDTLEGFKHLYTFTIVRNPWDRVVSAWKNKNPHQHETLASYLHHPFLSAPELMSLNDQDFANQAVYEWHNMPQVDYISWNGEIVVKDVFRFEKLKEDWGKIQIMTAVYAPLLHLNRSEREDYRTYYDMETINLVAERYAKDIKEFGYTFE